MQLRAIHTNDNNYKGPENYKDNDKDTVVLSL